MTPDETLSANALREITRLRVENDVLRRQLTDYRAEIRHAYRKLEAALRGEELAGTFDLLPEAGEEATRP